MSKRTKLLLIGALFTAFIGGCAPPANNTSQQPQVGKNIRIGFAMATVKEERWQRDHDAFAARCKELEVECAGPLHRRGVAHGGVGAKSVRPEETTVPTSRIPSFHAAAGQPTAASP